MPRAHTTIQASWWWAHGPVIGRIPPTFFEPRRTGRATPLALPALRSLIMDSGASVSLFHVAVRNPRVHKFLPISLVSQTRIELQCMGLSVQQEIADVP